MTTRVIGGLASMIVAAALFVGPGPGLAGDRQPGRADDNRDRGDHHRDRDHRRPSVLLRPSPFVRPAPGIRFGFVPPVPGYAPRPYAPPLIYYDYDAPGSVPPPPTYAPDATASIVPPGPSVVDYPNGRYELRGDGIWTPYTWVWVPKPPSAPPAEPPPLPAETPAAPAPERQTELYRWKDDAGVVHWTDRWDAVPEAYRARVTKLNS